MNEYKLEMVKVKEHKAWFFAIVDKHSRYSAYYKTGENYTGLFKLGTYWQEGWKYLGDFVFPSSPTKARTLFEGYIRMGVIK